MSDMLSDGICLVLNKNNQQCTHTPQDPSAAPCSAHARVNPNPHTFRSCGRHAFLSLLSGTVVKNENNKTKNYLQNPKKQAISFCKIIFWKQKHVCDCKV